MLLACCLIRLLDDNRELFVPELGEAVRAHPHFQLFATQNPAGYSALLPCPISSPSLHACLLGCCSAYCPPPWTAPLLLEQVSGCLRAQSHIKTPVSSPWCSGNSVGQMGNSCARAGARSAHASRSYMWATT